MSTSPNIRCQELIDVLMHLNLLPDIPERERIIQHRDELIRMVRDKIMMEIDPNRELVVAISGGTNVGKSSIFNLIIGTEFSPVTPLARGTKAPVLCGNGHNEPYRFLANVTIRPAEQVSEVLEEQDSDNIFYCNSDYIPQHTLLVDSPDIDSDHIKNNIWSQRLLTTCDCVLVVVTPEKYNDKEVIDYIRNANALSKKTAVIFNKRSGDEAADDFENNVRHQIDDSMSLYFIDYNASGNINSDQPVSPLRNLIHEWSNQRLSIKRKTLASTYRHIFHNGRIVIERLSQELKWLNHTDEILSTSIEEAVKEFRDHAYETTYLELDDIFKRVLKIYKIPIIEDFYTGISWPFRKALQWVKSGLSWKFHDFSESEKKRILQERIVESYEKSASLLFQLPSFVDPPIRHLTDQWLKSIQPSLGTKQLNGFMERYQKDVEKWIDEEVKQISDTVKNRPGRYRFLKTTKALLQIGSGVFGALLTGGLQPTDAIIAPAFERTMAYLIKSGMEVNYFPRKQRLLVQMKCDILRGFLEMELIKPIKEKIPDIRDAQDDCLMNALKNLPSPKEILS